MKLTSIAVAAGALLALAATSTRAAEDPAARDLIKKALDAAPKGAFEADSTLSSDRGWSREMKFYHKDVGGVDSVFIDVTGPRTFAGPLMKDGRRP